MPTAADLKLELHRMLSEAQKAGKDYVDISARELHERVGGNEGRDHRMPNCCQVMKAHLAQDYGDVILDEPPSGQGPSLTIRYRLPRLEVVEL